MIKQKKKNLGITYTMNFRALFVTEKTRVTRDLTAGAIIYGR